MPSLKKVSATLMTLFALVAIHGVINSSPMLANAQMPPKFDPQPVKIPNPLQPPQIPPLGNIVIGNLNETLPYPNVNATPIIGRGNGSS